MNPATLSSSRLNPDLPKWQPATWEDYLAYCDAEDFEGGRAFYHQGYLWIDMGNEGIDHARVNNLFAMLFFLWFSARGQIWDDLGGCVLEKPQQQGAAPDRLVYIGSGSPQWQAGERRRINLDIWRVPDLVGEVSDTTLATDLDEKKQLYAALKIPEYWAIDIQGKRVIAFCLQENGKYEQVNFSLALEGLPIALLSKTLERLTHETNGTAAQWFAQQIVNL
ncbi:Uma2 family endonuclease [Laspinema palackyanum]|uniref:Uma2 family endonuclease n=1 Tax=Laspinema palackyanum TaxID=3231601 RepID=UPI00345CBC6B|nr:Uma2 family endonuclease [Laspinema sp. D2c]